MKTIQISDELYSKLMELATEVKTQDNRGTANVFFQIEDVQRVPAYEDCGEGVFWYNGGLETELETDEEIKEFLIEHFTEEKGLSEEEANDKYNELDKWDIDNLLEDLEFTSHEYSYEKVYKNAFLTAKECKRHLENNDYHYSEKARSYGSCAWRNRDIEIIHEFLNEITQ